jgi:hypothetical protein
MGEHTRPKARYCCKGHMLRAQAQNRAATMKLRRIHARIDANVKERARTRRHWRDVAMGRDVQLHLGAIFGGKRDVRAASKARVVVRPFDAPTLTAAAPPRVSDPAQAVAA